MKKVMHTIKKIVREIREWFIWIFDRRVLDAINEGKSYEEITELVRSL